jgi:hypothetical protein
VLESVRSTRRPAAALERKKQPRPVRPQGNALEILVPSIPGTDKKRVAGDDFRGDRRSPMSAPRGSSLLRNEVLMPSHCQEDRVRKSVRLSPGFEALECRKLLSGPGPATTTVAAISLVRPAAATELLKAHKVIAFRIPLPADVSLPPTGDLQPFSLVPVRPMRVSQDVSGPAVPLASAAYDQAHQTLTLTPAVPAPVREYRLTMQASNGSDQHGGQTAWTTLIRPPNQPSRHVPRAFPWVDFNPLAWPALLSGFH